MKRIVIILSFLIGLSTVSFAQKQVRKDIREGNKEYKQEKYTDAEVDYRKALEGNARSIEAAYNLGNALYKQSKMQEAFEQYQAVIKNETDKSKLSATWHNVGNIFMFAQDYQKSIEAYKNALRNNPRDDESRYNLALAQKLLDDQEKEKEEQQQENQEKEQQEQQQNQEQNQQEKEQEQKQDQQPNPNEMSKQNADQILDALMQDEKNTQEKVKAEQMQQQQQRKTDKNW